MIEGIFKKGNDLILRYNKQGASYFKKIKATYPVYISDRNGDYRYIFRDVPMTKRVYNNKKDLKETLQIAELSNQLVEAYDPEIELRYPLWKKFQNTRPNSLIWFLDIEVIDLNNRKFPQPYLADAPITHIQIADNFTDKVVLLMTKAPSDEFYKKWKDNTEIIVYNSEEELLEGFIKKLKSDNPTIITAWNGENFDFPYITFRAKKLGININKFSPLNEAKVDYDPDNKIYTTRWNGLYLLDALQVYKKFTYSEQKSYSLEYIAKIELGEGEGKVDYGEYQNIFNFFEQNYDKFCEYARKDPIVLKNIIEKTDLFNILIDMANVMGLNYDRALGTVGPWSRNLLLLLLDENVIVPTKPSGEKSAPIKGGFVKDPIKGKHEWICSIDFNSLYPSIMLSFNLSPETYVPYEDLPQEAREILDYMADEDETKLFDPEFRQKIKAVTQKHNLIFAGLGFFRKDRQGIIPRTIEGIYYNRKKQKNKALLAKAILAKYS